MKGEVKVSKKIYIILKSHQSGKYKSIRCGDSYFAVFFSSLWALYHGLFSIFFLNILFYVVIFSSVFFQLDVKFWATLLICIWGAKCEEFRKYGNCWLIKKKIKEGYIIMGVVETGNFFKVISLYKQNVNEKRLAKRNLRKLKTDKNILETGEQCINMEILYLHLKDLKTYRNALLKVMKWKNSELLELCKRYFHIYWRDTLALSKVVVRNIKILERNKEVLRNVFSNEKTMKEEIEVEVSLSDLMMLDARTKMMGLDMKILEAKLEIEKMVLEMKKDFIHCNYENDIFEKWQDSQECISLEHEHYSQLLCDTLTSVI